jgi:hypothetical protein
VSVNPDSEMGVIAGVFVGLIFLGLIALGWWMYSWSTHSLVYFMSLQVLLGIIVGAIRGAKKSLDSQER